VFLASGSKTGWRIETTGGAAGGSWGWTRAVAGWTVKRPLLYITNPPSTSTQRPLK
jgi:hypothetical protein